MRDSEMKMSRRERRRRRNEEKWESEDNEDIVVKQKKFGESVPVAKNSRTLTRMDTFTVVKSKTVVDATFIGDINKSGSSREDDEDVVDGCNAMQPEDSDDSKDLTITLNEESPESKQFTYCLEDSGSSSKHDTYDVPKIWSGTESERPVPAPRTRLSNLAKDFDKVSSDTDKDVMEIEIDDANQLKSSPSEPSAELPVPEAPVPKPRKPPSINQTSLPKMDSLSKSKSLEEVTVKVASPRSIKSDPEKRCLRVEMSTEVRKPKHSPINRTKKSRRLANLLQRRREQKKEGGSFALKLDRPKIPTISSLLRLSKEDSSEVDDKLDFQMDTSQFPQAEPNDQLYVQSKNGFYMKSKKEIFNQRKDLLSGSIEKMDLRMSSTVVRTAMLFQKYWSRSMVYFHGILAGIGFGHAFTVTAVMFYFHDDSWRFVDVYSCLALKIHFIFYALTTLCIISCLDRLDIGHLKRKHWEFICGRFPSLWIIFLMYASSFVLTFVNHSTVSRFDSHQYENVTDERLWHSAANKDLSSDFSSWYRIIWARDLMVLSAWLLISLTKYPDNLHQYMIDLTTGSDDRTKYGERTLSPVIS